jgi:integrase
VPLATLRSDAGASPDALPLDTKLFQRPPTIRIFDADCQAAGIPKTDRRGRVVDIHALRHTFGTHLSAAGVHARVAMAATCPA